MINPNNNPNNNSGYISKEYLESKIWDYANDFINNHEIEELLKENPQDRPDFDFFMSKYVNIIKAKAMYDLLNENFNQGYIDNNLKQLEKMIDNVESLMHNRLKGFDEIMIKILNLKIPKK